MNNELEPINENITDEYLVKELEKRIKAKRIAVSKERFSISATSKGTGRTGKFLYEFNVWRAMYGGRASSQKK